MGVLCALMLLLVPAATAKAPLQTAGAQSLAFAQGWNQIQQPVEQESPNFIACGGAAGDPSCFTPDTWVYNPYGPGDPFAPSVQSPTCIWDVDDGMWANGQGTLDGSVSGRVCEIADGQTSFGHSLTPQVIVTAPSDSLTVTLTSSYGGSWTLTPTPNGRSNYAYQLCTIEPTQGPYPDVLYSNGGTGFPVTYTLTVSSLKKTNGVFAVVQVGNGTFGIC